MIKARLKTLFLLLSSCLCLYIKAQQKADFIYFQKDLSKEQSLIKEINDRYEKDVASISGKNKKYITEIYKERVELIKNIFTEKEALTDPEALQYLDAITNEIIKANPGIDFTGLRILFSRTYIPNACSMGEGTILFNIGLFHRLQNESEACFILCHELAHYLLGHSNNNIHQYVNTVYSEEFQKKLKAIQKTEYGRNKQLDALEKGLLFRTRRHSREYEHAADSVALELMKNTNYDLGAVLTCLAILDEADNDKYSGTLKLAEQFNFPDYPFKKSWLESEDLLSFSPTEKEQKILDHIKDSLKTHPDCKARIADLSEKVNQYQKAGNKKFIISEQKFRELKTEFDFEILEYCLQTDQVSRCFYFALQLTNKFPDNAYLCTTIGKCLNQMYVKGKNRELSKITDLPNTLYNDDYNDLLNFIQNLRLTEIGALAYYFLLQNQSRFGDNRDFIQELNTSKENFKK